MFTVERLQQVVVMVVKSLFELPKKDVVGYFEFAYERVVVSGENAAGNSGGLGPGVRWKVGDQECLDFRPNESVPPGCVRRGAVD